MNATSDQAKLDEPSVDRPAWAPFALMGFIGLVACTNVASAVWARWVNTNPEGLLALSSRNRYLALCLAAGVPLLSYVLIAFVRLSVAFVICHLIGRAYSDKVLRWFRRFLGVNQKSLDAFQNGFEKSQWILIPFFAGSNIVAAISGIHRTPPRRLAGLLAVGIGARLVLIWWLARQFEDSLKHFLNVLQRYQLPALIVSIALVVIANIRNLRGGAS